MRERPRCNHSSGETRSPALEPTSMSLTGENAQTDGSGTGKAVNARSSLRMMLCVKWSIFYARVSRRKRIESESGTHQVILVVAEWVWE